jgi:hypothetical protein
MSVYITQMALVCDHDGCKNKIVRDIPADKQVSDYDDALVASDLEDEIGDGWYFDVVFEKDYCPEHAAHAKEFDDE